MDGTDIWERVKQFALARLADGQPVLTNEKGVKNYIADVKDGSIGRKSDDGTTNASRVTRGEVIKLWAELNGGPPADVLYFTRALLPAAVPELVDVVGGKLRLRRDATPDRGEVPIEDPIGLPEKARGRSQGFIRDQEIKVALEAYGMQRAAEYFTRAGFDVDPSVHKTQPYDLLCRKGDEVLYVEVKATSTLGEQVLLTRNEVEFAREHRDQMALYIMHSIDVERTDTGISVSGGVDEVVRPWDVDRGALTPISYWWRVAKDG